MAFSLISDPLELRSQTAQFSVLIIALLLFFLRFAVALYPGIEVSTKPGAIHASPQKGRSQKRALFAQLCLANLGTGAQCWINAQRHQQSAQISESVVFKWLKRYPEVGLEGLNDPASK
jgi:hypothetical protein